MDSSSLLNGEIKYKMQWFNLYGSNPEYEGKNASMQNEDPDAATTFKGRVLIEYSLINDEHPVMKMRDIE